MVLVLRLYLLFPATLYSNPQIVNGHSVTNYITRNIPPIEKAARYYQAPSHYYSCHK